MEFRETIFCGHCFYILQQAREKRKKGMLTNISHHGITEVVRYRVVVERNADVLEEEYV